MSTNSANATKSDSRGEYILLNNYGQLAKKLGCEESSEIHCNTRRHSLCDEQTQIDKLREGGKNGKGASVVGFISLFRYSSACEKILLIIATIISIISSISMPLNTILIGDIINKLIAYEKAITNCTAEYSNCTGNVTEITEVFLHDTATQCLYYIIICAYGWITNYIFVAMFSIAAASQVFKIRCMFMASILKQDIGWYDTTRTGGFANRITGDLRKVQDGIGDKVGIFINYVAITIACVAVGIYSGWKLALVTLCTTPVLTISMAVMTKVQTSASKEETEACSKAGAIAEEALSAIRTVVAFGGERKEIERYENCLIPAKQKGIKRGLMTSIASGMSWSCVFFGYALAFWYGVKLILEGRDQEHPEYTAGTLVTVFLTIISGSFYFGLTPVYFETFTQATGAAANVFEIIERKPLIDSSSCNGDKPIYVDGNITLKDVYFSYPSRPAVPILQGVSLKMEAGKTVALVGPSGCGKSTIIQLILRFYDADSGSLALDGHDTKDLNVGWLRDNISLVGQEPVLFSTTIEENIRHGKPDATLEKVRNAAKLANVQEFIESLPMKYQTLVGEGGAQLSGGQKQRIAIARAVIKNPKILLLDEATSALDTESESVVQAALDAASLGRTTVVVAHRLSTIRNAYKIVVLTGGKVKEVGTHYELVQQKGIYYSLVSTQTAKTTLKKEESADFVPTPMLRQRQISSVSSNSYKSEDESPYLASTSLLTESLALEDEDEVVKASPPKGRLMKLFAPEWPYATVGSIAAALTGLHFPVYGILFGSIVGALKGTRESIKKETDLYCLLFFFLGISIFLCTFCQVFMFSIAGERLTFRLRKMVFSNIITQDMSFFDNPKNSVGSLCSRLTSDASNVQGATGSRVSTLLQTISTLIGSIIIGLYFNWKIGLVVMAFIPVVLISTFLESRLIKGGMEDEKISAEAATKIAVECIEGIRTVAALHQEQTFYDQFKNSIHGPYKRSRLKSHMRGVVYGLAQSIQGLVFAAAIFYGRILIADREITYGNLLKVFQGVTVGVMMVGQTIAFAPDYQMAKVSAVRILKLLDIRTKIEAFSEEGHVLNSIKGNIRFRDVRFSYPSRPDSSVLKGLSFEIESGKTVALVGGSGCGKSTCVQLIERFYDILSGTVMLDDVNVKEMNIANLRSHLGLVSQEPVLFSYSIAENIAYGDNSRIPEINEVITAAKEANIHTFITSLPQGYDTPVGGKGSQLSGGQKQRVAIARALLRKPKVLLLDEATSALDAESERIVQEALDKARSGRTCIIIAHRLTTIENADLIIVIHNGKVVERGTHQELLGRKGHYYNLHHKQG